MEGSSLFRFALAVLATWRVTHLLAHEDGPADLIFRFRRLLAQGWAGSLLDCFHCLSLWIAAPAALFVSTAPVDWLFAWWGLSGAACLLERATAQPVVFEPMPPPQPSASAEGDFHHVLRSEALVTDAAQLTSAGQRR